MRESAQLLQAPRDGGCKALLAADVGGHDEVQGRLPLVAAVGAPQLLHLHVWKLKVSVVGWPAHGVERRLPLVTAVRAPQPLHLRARSMRAPA